MVNKVKIIQKTALIYKNKVLVLKRSLTDDSRPGTWDLVGGNVDDADVVASQEDILVKALKREVKEEIGVDVNENNFNPVYADSGANDEGILIVWIGYEYSLEEKPEVKISEEHIEYKWVTREEFMELDFGFAKDTMQKIIKEVNFT